MTTSPLRSSLSPGRCQLSASSGLSDELGLCVPVTGSPVQALWLRGPACLRAFRRDADLSRYRDACVTPQCPCWSQGYPAKPRARDSPPAPGPRAPLPGPLRRRFSRASGVAPRAALCPAETMGLARLCSRPAGRWVGRHLQVSPWPATTRPRAAGTKHHKLDASPSILSPSGAQAKVGRGRSPPAALGGSFFLCSFWGCWRSSELLGWELSPPASAACSLSLLPKDARHD